MVKEELVHHSAGLAADPRLAEVVMSALLDHGRLRWGWCWWWCCCCCRRCSML